MNITFVSRSWPSSERSGVSLIAAQHVKILASEGHSISIIGSSNTVIYEDLPVFSRLYVSAQGSGSLYSPIRVNKESLRQLILSTNPELIVVEAWQPALTDTAIDVAHELQLPILMISHGVSVFPYTKRVIDIGRGLAWIWYRFNNLKNRIKKLAVITTLDDSAVSERFYDRDIARQLGIPIVPLVNAPVNWSNLTIGFQQRKQQILVIGYFSTVKNQLAALDVFTGLPDTLKLRFIGPQRGFYYGKCRRRVAELGLERRVIFSQDDECNISDEIANSLLVLSTSITEVLPVTLLEAMASGTPFVATPVGAVPNLYAGVISGDIDEQRNAIKKIVCDEVLWRQLSEQGKRSYSERYTHAHVRSSLLDAVSLAASSVKFIV